MFCSPNSRSCIADGISRICGSPLTDDLGKYVGMPLIHSRVNKHTYAGLLDKIQCRLSSWKSKTSNMAGRLLSFILLLFQFLYTLCKVANC